MTFLGIDIGYDRCGICVIEYSFENNSTDIVFAGSILTDKNLPIAARLKILHEDLLYIKQKYSPDYISIEKLFFNRRNSVFEKICMSKGVALMLFQDSTIVEIEPKSIKKNIIGEGNATKAQIKEVLTRILQVDLSKVLDDTLDALCIGLYHVELVKIELMSARKQINVLTN